MKAETFKKLVDGRVDRLKGHFEQGLEKRSLSPEQKAEIEKTMDGTLKELHAAVEKVSADGVVTPRRGQADQGPERLTSARACRLRASRASTPARARATRAARATSSPRRPASRTRSPPARSPPRTSEPSAPSVGVAVAVLMRAPAPRNRGALDGAVTATATPTEPGGAYAGPGAHEAHPDHGRPRRPSPVAAPPQKGIVSLWVPSDTYSLVKLGAACPSWSGRNGRYWRLSPPRPRLQISASRSLGAAPRTRRRRARSPRSSPTSWSPTARRRTPARTSCASTRSACGSWSSFPRTVAAGLAHLARLALALG